MGNIKKRIKIAFRQKSNKDKNKLLNWSIRFLTKSKFHHVELIINDTWISSSNTSGGFRIRPLEPINQEDSRYIYHDLGLVKLTSEQDEIISRFMENQLGSEYDYSGIIFSQLFPFSKHSRTRWFCSEIVTKLLQLHLIEETLDLIPNEVSPGDLAKLFNVE